LKRFGLGSLLSSAAGLSRAAARNALLEAASHISQGSLAVELPGGEVRAIGPSGREPGARVLVKDDAVFVRLLSGGEMAVGETYMEGIWDSPDLTKLLTLGILNREHAPAALKKLEGLAAGLGRVLERPASSVPRQSTDQPGSDFYSLFLDESLSFSCPIYSTPDQSLAQAQANKFGVLAEKAGLTSTHHLLEAGPGWGGFGLYAAGAFGCHVSLSGLSREQREFVSRRAAEAGLSQLVSVTGPAELQVGAFDRIVSIETLHSGAAGGFPNSLRESASLLRPGGRMVLQTLAVSGRAFEEQRGQHDWIEKYIFPGGLVPSVEALHQAATSDGLRILEVTDISENYPPTLRQWRSRLALNSEGARDLGFDERFLRMWDFYFCATEAAFLTKSARALQLVLEKTA
jgi:cyclopropane-fatty-acyl-phospholipid synthase